MESLRARHLLVLLGVAIGCFHYPHEALLMGLADQPGETFFADPRPQYIGFADGRTELVFKRLVEKGGYVVALDGSTLICPGLPAEGMHGYLLRFDVDSVMGDSAIATLVQSCVREPRKCAPGSDTCTTLNSGVRVTTTNYLLVRRSGTWTLAQPFGKPAVITD